VGVLGLTSGVAGGTAHGVTDSGTQSGIVAMTYTVSFIEAYALEAIPPVTLAGSFNLIVSS